VSHRRERVARELRDRLAGIVSGARDPRLHGIAILEVRPSPDLSYARVFFRTLGDRAEAEAALEGARGFLRSELAGAVRLRRVPELDFRFDESPERGGRIEEVLRELGREDA
jgi:ribosome-binding factor A